MSKTVFVAPVSAGGTLTSRKKRVYLTIDGKVRSCLFESKEVKSNLGSVSIRAAYETSNKSEIEQLTKLGYIATTAVVANGKTSSKKDEEKEHRVELFASLERFGSKAAKNITTKKLENLVKEAEQKHDDEILVTMTAELEAAGITFPEDATFEEVVVLFDELRSTQ